MHILILWFHEQATVLDELRGSELCLAGEGRTDTPGHFADFGTYTLLETTANHILRKELVKVDHYKIKSAAFFLDSGSCLLSTNVTQRSRFEVEEQLKLRTVNDPAKD